MRDAVEELDRCLAELEQLARDRLSQSVKPVLKEQYERLATIARNARESGAKSGWPQMGNGAGLAFSRGLGDWGISTCDPEVMRLAYKIDELHQTGVRS
jgi:hypothetical protein